jgi:hypothetical protein
MSDCSVCGEESEIIVECIQCEVRVCLDKYCSVFCRLCDGHYCPDCTCEHLDH